MKTIGILSDTHSCWDDRYAAHFAGCDEIWHAGDIGDITILERLRAVYARDPPEAVLRLPQYARIQKCLPKRRVRNCGNIPSRFLRKPAAAVRERFFQLR